jgi:phosphohistidine phosphatase SixA
MEFIAIRHANAAAPEGQEDWGRNITPQGLQQALSVQEMLKHELGAGWKPDVVYLSPVPRVRQTLDIILGTGRGRNVSVHELPALWSHPDKEVDKKIGEMFEDLKHTPLIDYMHKYDGAREIFELASAAHITIREINNALLRRSKPAVDRVVIGGHGVLLPALMYVETRDTYFLKNIMPEAAAYIVNGNSSVISLYPRSA